MDKNDLESKLNQIGKELLINYLPNYLDNKINLREQKDIESTYAHKIHSKDNLIFKERSII